MNLNLPFKIHNFQYNKTIISYQLKLIKVIKKSNCIRIFKLTAKMILLVVQNLPRRKKILKFKNKIKMEQIILKKKKYLNKFMAISNLIKINQSQLIKIINISYLKKINKVRLMEISKERQKRVNKCKGVMRVSKRRRRLILNSSAKNQTILEILKKLKMKTQMIILEILIIQNHENLLKTLENLNSLKLKRITSVISQHKKNKSDLFLKSNKITSQI